MGIKRGVSLYSYQQAEFFHKMTWKDQLREVATNLGGATGIEIISEATVYKYPIPPERFYYDWNNEMARWGLTAVTMDTFLDVLQFRDHVMTHAEVAEHIKYDIRIAHNMGFKNIRIINNIPYEALERALPLAEELDVCLLDEIHYPCSIKPTGKLPPDPFINMNRIPQDIEFIERTKTKHYGLMPDFGIFQHRPCRLLTEYTLRQLMPEQEAHDIVERTMEVYDTQGSEAGLAWFKENYKDIWESNHFLLFAMISEPCAQPVDLFDIAPYIRGVHGKFYDMTEIPGKPGQYQEECILYKEAIDVLKGIGYDGYINSEYEGQRAQQDRGDGGLADEVEQVRRHHEMLRRLIGE